MTSITVDQDRLGVAVIVSGEKYVREGTFPIMATLPDHSPLRWEVSVRDRRPYSFAAAIDMPGRAGRESTVTVSLLDRHGETADLSIGGAGILPLMRVDIHGPAGAVDVILEDRCVQCSVPLVFLHGIARYHFTPPAPGMYTLTFTGSDVAPWPIRPVVLRFTVTR